MDLQEKLIELSEYDISFNVAKGNFVIKIRYNDNWTIIQPDNKDIAFYRDESGNSIYYYVAPVSISIEELFSAIDETIDYNHELELKVKLFRKKMEELQDIFTKESLEVLNTLEFKVKKKKNKKEKVTDDTSKVVEETKEQTDSIKSDVADDVTEAYPNDEAKTVSEIDEKIGELLQEKNLK